MSERPFISVICLNKNHAGTMRQALDSVVAQTVPGLEFIVADGGSTDGSLEVLRSYPKVRLLDGADRSRSEGVMRAVAAASGKYIAFTTTTDGYLLPEWLQIATDHLERNPDVAMVWGASIIKDGDRLVSRFYPKQFPKNEPVPQREEWFFGWARHGLSRSYLPELNYCMPTELYRTLIAPTPEAPAFIDFDPILRMLFQFIKQGYMPEYLPVLANFGRAHPDQAQFTPEVKAWEATFDAERKAHVARLVAGEIEHVWRAPDGRVLRRLPRAELIERLNRDEPTAGKRLSLPAKIAREVRRVARRAGLSG